MLDGFNSSTHFAVSFENKSGHLVNGVVVINQVILHQPEL